MLTYENVLLQCFCNINDHKLSNQIPQESYQFFYQSQYNCLANLYFLQHYFFTLVDMFRPTPIDEFLLTIHMQDCNQALKDYGVQTLEDLFLITPEEWVILKILPFHRNKIIHAAAILKEQKTQTIQKKVEQMQKCSATPNYLNQYKLTSSVPYTPNQAPQNLKNFEATGYALAQCNDCFMKFTFQMPIKIYGMIIGNSFGDPVGWNHTYLEGVQVQVKQSNSNEYKTVHTINGMPTTANAAYLAKIDTPNVEEVRLWKVSYFSTSFINFV